MKTHVNVEWDDKVPDYVIHDDTKICGFFGEYRFLSNFYPSENGVWWMGTKFPAVEHAYQAAKFPKKYHKEFVDVTAGQSKKLAKMMTKADPSLFDKSRWELIKLRVMADLVFQKFNFDPSLEQLLHDTKDKYLEETNSWKDVFWGVYEGNGQNQLGKILTQTRTFWK